MVHPLPRDADPDWADLALALVTSRHSVAPKRLRPPGPSDDEVRQLVQAAACAPDHRQLRPWRFVRIADHQRAALADLFEAIAGDRQPPPTPEDIEKSRAKALRAPTLLLAVLRLAPEDPEVPEPERAVSAGAALMNLLLVAHAMGYAGMLTSGRSVRTERFARAFALGAQERALCFVSLGTADELRPRPRPSPHELLSDWAGTAGQNVPG